MKLFFSNSLSTFSSRRQTVFLATLGAFFILALVFLPIHGAEAKVSDYLADALGWLLGSVIFPLLGAVLKWILEALVSVAEFNKIINQPTIQKTWGTVRDIVNMFFIFAILLIAFSTILRIRQYEVKQLLPKLILYAILVNFSLTICGLFIDIAQVFTLTFVNAFKENAVHNFTEAVNIFDFTSMSSDLKDTAIKPSTVMVGYLLALVLMLVTLVTLGAMVLILLVRIVYLWVLSILSPFAFVLPVIPGGQKYASQWWSMFSKYVITGPLLAFFIWLSLSVLANTGNIGNEILNQAVQSKMTSESGTGLKITDTDFVIHFIISIAMMFVGLMLTAQMGGAMSKIAGGASGWMQGTARGAMNWGRRQAWRGGVYAATSPYRAAAWGAREWARRDVDRQGQVPQGGGPPQQSRLLQMVERGGITGFLASRAVTGARRRQQDLEEDETRRVRRMLPSQRRMEARAWWNRLTPRGRARTDAIQEIDPGTLQTPVDTMNAWNRLSADGIRGIRSVDIIRRIRDAAIATNNLIPTVGQQATPAEVASVDTFLHGHQFFNELNNQQQNRVRNNFLEVREMAQNSPIGQPLSQQAQFVPPQVGWQYRPFGEVSGEAEPSPNDIVSGDMVVNAKQVNVTGDKAGSTLGKDLGDPGKTSGVDSLLRRGLKDGVGRLAIDFNRLGLTGAGANLVGEGKAQMIPKLLEQLRKEGRTPAELQSIEQELQKAQSLSLINKTRNKGDVRKIISHEAIHDVLDDGVSIEERRGMWNKMDPQKQVEIEKKIRANWAGGDKMSQDQVIEEYLANGLTNETRWGDKSEHALKLDKSVQDELRKKGVFKKMNEGLVHRMSEKDIKTPDALKTEEEFRKHNEQVATQSSGQVIHQTLTGKAQEEAIETVAEEIEEERAGTSEEKSTGKKKEEKPVSAPPAYRPAEIRTIPQVQSVVKQVMESSTKGMMDPLFFRKMSAEFNKAIGALGAKLTGSQYEQTQRLSKLIGGLQEAAQHSKSDNPLIKESAKQEYDVKLEEFKNEYYNIMEAPASEDEIKNAIGDLSNKS